MKKEDSPLLILEIGTEEIPARFVTTGMARLKEAAAKLFSEHRLVHGEIKTYGTPRRLALIAEVEPFQHASEREIWGPPVHIAFDSNGNPTKAAEAFARNSGISIEHLNKKEKNKGIYITATIRESSTPVKDLLPEVLQRLVLSLSFPKAMRWGSGAIRFVRPIHWILALYDNKKVTFEIEGIKSGNMSKGHRFLSPAAFEIKDARSYINLLRNNLVILDRKERKNIIVDSSERLASSVNSFFLKDEELLEHVADLVEFPQAALASFSADYLVLPEELLITVMKGHQKYFALRDSQGKLTNHFIIISNTKADNMETVMKGAQKVIKARFEDARFYYEEDKKTPLLQRAEGLKKVIYHERLGSIDQKVQRIKRLAEYIANTCCPKRLEDVRLAAGLCKADLISGVVREFPELQGIMGGYYAKIEGYPMEVVNAIRGHYSPRFAGDDLPNSETAIVISLADKIDNLAAFFSIGEIPSGAEDPFALRRQCYGVVSMLIERKYPLTAEHLISYALDSLTPEDIESVKAEVLAFVGQRFEFYMQNRGYEQDVINSLMDYIGRLPLFSLRQRAEALKVFKQKDYYASLLMAIKRVNNIAQKGDMPSIDTSLLQEVQERSLYDASIGCNDRISRLVGEGNYIDAIESLNTMQPYINSFFDKVLVMDKREEIRQNRLSLVKYVQSMGALIADFSRLA